jgi:hypothetical protein
MTDIAELGFSVDSAPVDKGSRSLDKLSNSAKRAENAAKGFSSASGRAAASANGVAGASKRTASAMAAEAAAVKQATMAHKAHGVAVNDNTRRMGGSFSGLAAQFQDIGVTAAMGMNPMIIALQQGTQIAGQMEMAMQSGGSAAGVLGQAFRSLLSPVALVSIGLTAVLAAGFQLVNWGSTASAALNLVADALESVAEEAAIAGTVLAVAFAPKIAMAVWGLTAALGKGLVGALKAVSAAAMANPITALMVALAAAVTAVYVFRDEIEQAIGVDIVTTVKNAVNFVIGAFVGGFEAVKQTWAMLPGALGDLVYQAANATIAGVETMINKISGLINEFLSGVDRAISSLPFGVGEGVSVGRIDAVTLPRLENKFAGQASATAETAQAAATSGMGTDYLGTIGGVISKGASAGAAKLRELAQSIMEVEDADKKGGKTAAEKYSGIVSKAQQRIASLKAEQMALGMTEEQALRLKYTTDLLNQAQQANINLSAGQRAQLAGLAAEMARTEIATKQTKEAMDFAKSSTNGFLSDLRSGLMQGKGLWESFGAAAMNVLDKVIDKLQTQLVDAIFSANGALGGGGGGGILGGLFSGLLGIFGFANGGYTGNGAASSVAGVVHGGEYVFSKKATDRIGVANLEAMHSSARGYANGGYVAPAMPANSNRPQAVHVTVGVSVDDQGELQAYVKSVSERTVGDAAPGIVSASVSKAREATPAAMAEYEQKRAGGDWRA